MTSCIVIVKNPVLRASQNRTFTPNVLSQTLEDVRVELLIDGLVLGEEFMTGEVEAKRDGYALE